MQTVVGMIKERQTLERIRVKEMQVLLTERLHNVAAMKAFLVTPLFIHTAQHNSILK